MKLSIVIPVFNEVGTIEEIILRVQPVPFEKEIIVVDDYSTDCTVHLLRKIDMIQENIKVYYHDRNPGIEPLWF
jgi:glycosyltransferase involved in cell wall biosynthesis